MSGKYKYKQSGKAITCSNCGEVGGTLIKDSKGNYKHQDVEKCRIMEFRKILK